MYTAKVNVHYVGYTAGIVPLDWSITGLWSEWTPALCGQSGTSPALVYDMARFVNQIAGDFTPSSLHSQLTWQREIAILRRHGGVTLPVAT